MGQRLTKSSTISAAHCACFVEKEARGSSLPTGLACEHPANGQRLGPSGRPERCAGSDFELALGPARPFHEDGFPLRLRVAPHRTQIRKPFPDNAWPSLLMALRWGRWRKEPCIQAQRSNQAHRRLDTPQAKVNDTVGTLPNHFDRDLRQPAAHSCHHRLGPIERWSCAACPMLHSLLEWLPAR